MRYLSDSIIFIHFEPELCLLNEKQRFNISQLTATLNKNNNLPILRYPHKTLIITLADHNQKHQDQKQKLTNQKEKKYKVYSCIIYV